ncbi:MAG: hypothetical protein RL094_294 [Candidatus Parcubacteria bacterium]|jgi:hypothetical protein
MKRSFIAGSVIALGFLSCVWASPVDAAASSSIPANFKFTKTLVPGMYSDPEVKYLQIILNKNIQTQVAPVGPGSSQMPTAFYGELTKNAVMRFQMLYMSEILVPLGIPEPTGVVGENTRKKLNQLLANGAATAETSYMPQLPSLPSFGGSGSDSSSGSGSGSGSGSSGSSGSGAAAAGTGVGVAALAGGAGGSTGGTGTGGASGASPDYFGGSITNVTYCTCSVSIMLDIQDKVTNSTLTVLYTPGVSTLHANYNVFSSGPNVIGGYTPGGAQCQVYVGESCESEGNPRGTIDYIRGIGTSLK